MINGALQGRYDGEGRKKVIIALGSSHPDVVTYTGNLLISATGGCSLSPCGAHGYFGCDGYEKEFGKTFFGTEQDKSGCIFSDYNKRETARCMEAIPAEQIIATIKFVLS